MCTVTFLPLADNGYILTSSRDESPDRNPTLPPSLHRIHQRDVFFPKDPMANGTWIAADRSHFTLCLLNGAFQKHERKATYKTSRGIMLLDFFKFNEVERFMASYDFHDIEPFTLLILDATDQLDIYELRWDGLKLHDRQAESNHPGIWSSVTLYDPDTILRREKWFSSWLAQSPPFVVDQVLDFHKYGGKGTMEDNFLMNRKEQVKTLSITAVLKSKDRQEMIHEDLVRKKTARLELTNMNETESSQMPSQ